MDQKSSSKLSQYLAQESNQRSAVEIIIKLNIVIFLLWFLIGFQVPIFMIKNFLISWNALTEGRIWTLLTSFFSHNLLWHLFLNMYVLYSFGPVLEKILGLRRFLKFYLLSGIFSSFSHALVCALILDRPELAALGASGAISAVVILFALLFPKEKIFILGLIPVPALSGALILSGLDVWGLISQAKGHDLPIGHGAHLGGVLFGIMYYFFQRYRAKNRIFLS